jgi:uncharacterized membrane protein YkgB
MTAHFSRQSPTFANVTRLAARGGIPALRFSLGVVYLWFGIPKFWSGVSPADQLATRTMGIIDMHTVPQAVSRDLLATMETTIGLGLVTGLFLPAVLVLFAVQMTGTLTPLLFFRSEMWSRTLVPTLEGQYILKNLVLIAAGIAITATLCGGGLVSSSAALDVDRKAAEEPPYPDEASTSTVIEHLLPEPRKSAEVAAERPPA